jgi:hypothetical protein
MDVLWNYAFGTHQDMKATYKRAKKFRKLGFFVEVDELSKQDNTTIFKMCSNDFYCNPAIMINDISYDLSKVIKTYEMYHKNQSFYLIKLYGPQHILNGIPVLQNE